MRVAYFVHLNFDWESGVTKKVFSQLTSWRTEGVEVRLFCVTRSKNLMDSLRNFPWAKVYAYEGGPFSRSRLLAMGKAVEEIIAWNPDVVYSRRDLYYPPVERLAKSLPLVLEINSDEMAELKIYNKAHALYHVLTRQRLDRHVSGFVFVTRALLHMPYFSRLKIPKRVVSNGVDLNDLPHLPPTRNAHPNLAFIGHQAPWHGVDKIVRMAKLFPEWRFHLIGIEPVGGLPENILAHGHLGKEVYLPILAQADVGIGTLALHRKNMEEASPLKVREYLALGLPVIIGYVDTDFPNGAPFLLRLPNTENNVEQSVELIKEFVESWRGKRVPRAAVSHLDAQIKEKERLSFLREARSFWERKNGAG